MLSSYLQKKLTTPTSNRFNPQLLFWFSLSLTFAAIYSILGLQDAFNGQYIVQDDARQHVFWMQRFIDPELFPDDLITNYFQSVAPVGYTTAYRVAAILGINPFLFNKLLPPIICAIAIAYCFGICMEILPVPAAAFIGSALLNQSLWMKDDLISATPRAFVYPLFLAFLYYLLRRSLLGCLAALVLVGLFYPQYIFIAAGLLILRLVQWQHRRVRLSPNRQDYLLCILGLLLSAALLCFYALTPSDFDPVLSVAQAQALPEFSVKGRSYFFRDNPWEFFLLGERSGLLHVGLVRPATLTLGVLLPILCQFATQFPLVRQISPHIRLLSQIIIVSVGMFAAAHALLFKLHLPSRYTEHTSRIVLAIAAGIVLTVILDAAFHLGNRAGSKNIFKYWAGTQLLAIASTILIAAALVFYPCFVDNFPLTKYKVGHFPALYQFLQAQPKDSLIASLAEEANNLPTFAQRPILVGREYAIPYHWGYYRQFRERTIELIQAQYSPDLERVRNFIQQFGIDLWLLEESSLTPEYLAKQEWLQPYQPAIREAQQNLAQGIIPALSGVVEDCSVFQNEGFIVLKTTCIL